MKNKFTIPISDENILEEVLTLFNKNNNTNKYN